MLSSGFSRLIIVITWSRIISTNFSFMSYSVDSDSLIDSNMSGDVALLCCSSYYFLHLFYSDALMSMHSFYVFAALSFNSENLPLFTFIYLYSFKLDIWSGFMDLAYFLLFNFFSENSGNLYFCLDMGLLSRCLDRYFCTFCDSSF